MCKDSISVKIDVSVYELIVRDFNSGGISLAIANRMIGQDNKEHGNSNAKLVLSVPPFMKKGNR